jgi:hypothetical protein
MSYVADGEYTWLARLEVGRSPVQPPRVTGKVLAGDHETPVIPNDGVRQPHRVHHPLSSAPSHEGRLRKRCDLRNCGDCPGRLRVSRSMVGRFPCRNCGNHRPRASVEATGQDPPDLATASGFTIELRPDNALLVAQPDKAIEGADMETRQRHCSVRTMSTGRNVTGSQAENSVRSHFS